MICIGKPKQSFIGKTAQNQKYQFLKVDIYSYFFSWHKKCIAYRRFVEFIANYFKCNSSINFSGYLVEVNQSIKAWSD